MASEFTELATRLTKYALVQTRWHRPRTISKIRAEASQISAWEFTHQYDRAINISSVSAFQDSLHNQILDRTSRLSTSTPISEHHSRASDISGPPGADQTLGQTLFLRRCYEHENGDCKALLPAPLRELADLLPPEWGCRCMLLRPGPGESNEIIWPAEESDIHGTRSRSQESPSPGVPTRPPITSWIVSTCSLRAAVTASMGVLLSFWKAAWSRLFPVLAHRWSPGEGPCWSWELKQLLSL